MYGKLIDNNLIIAPNPIIHGGDYIGNPLPDVYLAKGYKPVFYTNPPREPDEGNLWSTTWTERDDGIYRNWEQVPVPDNVLPDEAMEILFGGEN